MPFVPFLFLSLLLYPSPSFLFSSFIPHRSLLPPSSNPSGSTRRGVEPAAVAGAGGRPQPHPRPQPRQPQCGQLCQEHQLPDRARPGQGKLAGRRKMVTLLRHHHHLHPRHHYHYLYLHSHLHLQLHHHHITFIIMTMLVDIICQLRMCVYLHGQTNTHVSTRK